MKLGSRIMAVFSISCRCLSSYIHLRSPPIFSFSLCFRLLSLSSTVKVENTFQLQGRTDTSVVCFPPGRASLKELTGLHISFTASRTVMWSSLGMRCHSFPSFTRTEQAACCCSRTLSTISYTECQCVGRRLIMDQSLFGLPQIFLLLLQLSEHVW